MSMSKQIKIPKRLAGIKIPKGIRRGAVVKFMNTPAGQVVLAQALLLIGGAFGLGKARQSGKLPKSVNSLLETKDDIGDRASVTGAKLTQAFAAAAHAFRDAMEDTDGTARDDEAPEPSGKKGRVRPESPPAPH
jgi:hypothetical protein